MSKTIEVDCRLCVHCNSESCDKFGNDPNVAIKKCAETCFKSYKVNKMKDSKQFGSFYDAIEFYKSEYLKYLDLSKRLEKELELTKRERDALEQESLLKCERIEQLEKELKGIV